MALISRWDIRAENYSDGATVTSLADLAGSTPLNSALNVTKPTYNASLKAISFNAANSHCLGSSSLHSSLAAVPAGSSWSIFFLIYQTVRDGQFVGGFGNSAQVNSGLLARTFSDTSAPQFFLRDNTDSVAQTPTATTSTSLYTWQVLHATYNGTSVQVGIDGSNIGSVTLSEVLSGITWNQFALGAYPRSTTGNPWTGFLRECRVYNSDESSNLLGIVSSMKVTDPLRGINSFLKFRPVKQNRLMSLLVSETAFTENVSLDYFRTVAFKPTYRLTLDTSSFAVTINDPTTRDITLDSRALTLTANAATLTKFDSINTLEITLEPSAGWAYFDVTAVSTDERSIFYSQTASIGYQVAYQTSTTTGQTVSIATNGFVTVLGTGLGTFNFRIFNGTSWSSEYTFEVNPTISITTADIDDQITVAQTAATLSGTNLILADAARVRYGTARLDMQSYSPAASPTFNVPTLTDFFNSGMPLGSVTFELLRAL
jgi:hypothetical protein